PWDLTSARRVWYNKDCNVGRSDCERRTETMITIEPGRYHTNRTREWWDDPRPDDAARERAVAAALDLPAEIVEIVADSDEEVDLASVWLITEDHERAIGHVTTDPDGTIVVEILYDGYLVDRKSVVEGKRGDAGDWRVM